MFNLKILIVLGTPIAEIFQNLVTYYVVALYIIRNSLNINPILPPLTSARKNL